MAWIIKYFFSWADEIDIYGFELVKDKKFIDNFKDIVAGAFNDGKFVWTVGSNEDIEFINVEQFMEGVVIQEITLTEFDVIKDRVCSGHRMFGEVPPLLDNNEVIDKLYPDGCIPGMTTK